MEHTNLLDLLRMPKTPFNFKNSIREENEYLKFFQHINPQISKIVDCKVCENQFEFNTLLKNKQFKKVYINRFNSQTYYSTDYRKNTITDYILPFFANQEKCRILKQIDSDHFTKIPKSILQYSIENPQDEFIQSVSKLHPDFIGSIFTNWAKNPTVIYDESGERRIFIKNFYQNDYTTTVDTNYHKQILKNIFDDAAEKLKKEMQKICYDKMNLMNYNIIQNYTINIQNIQNISTVESNSQIFSQDVAGKLFKHFTNNFAYNDSKLYKYNDEKTEPNYGLWTEYTFNHFSKMIYFKNDIFVQFLSLEEQKYLKKFKQFVFNDLKSFYIDHNIEFDKYSHLIPIIGPDGIGKVLDLHENKLIEPQKSFFIKSCTKWSYNENDAKFYKNQMDIFLKKLFPKTEILEIVLAYIYKTLCGEKIKKALILTDDLDGDNGKSTFIKFIWTCFGLDYVSKGTKYLVKSNTLSSNPNNHNAGEHKLKNKRFLTITEASKGSSLNEMFFKEMVDDTINSITGRPFQKDSEFEFQFYANAIIACNYNEFFKFDTNDKNILKRMLVVQMQSKFNKEFVDDWENLKFKCDDNINNNILLWRSSFINVLLEIGDKVDVILNKIDTNIDLDSWMKKFLASRLGVNEDSTYDFEEWIKNHLELSTNPSEWVNLNELKKLLRESSLGYHFKSKEFSNVLKIWLSEINITTTDRYKYYVNGKRCEKKNIINNYKLKTK